MICYQSCPTFLSMHLATLKSNHSSLSFSAFFFFFSFYILHFHFYISSILYFSICCFFFYIACAHFGQKQQQQLRGLRSLTLSLRLRLQLRFELNLWLVVSVCLPILGRVAPTRPGPARPHCEVANKAEHDHS